MKTLEEMNVSELLTMKTATDEILTRYDRLLQTYAVLNDDSYFEKISEDEKKMFERKRVFNEIQSKINALLEDTIYENYR